MPSPRAPDTAQPWTAAKLEPWTSPELEPTTWAGSTWTARDLDFTWAPAPGAASPPARWAGLLVELGTYVAMERSSTYKYSLLVMSGSNVKQGPYLGIIHKIAWIIDESQRAVPT